MFLLKNYTVSDVVAGFFIGCGEQQVVSKEAKEHPPLRFAFLSSLHLQYELWLRHCLSSMAMNEFLLYFAYFSNYGQQQNKYKIKFN